MRRTSVVTAVLGALLGASVALAQPGPDPGSESDAGSTSEPGPAPGSGSGSGSEVGAVAPIPVPLPLRPRVVAPDGAAANYEVHPHRELSVPGTLLRGLGTGASWVVRIVLAPIRGALLLQARYSLFTRIKHLFVNEAGTLGVYPTASYKSGFGFTLGAQAFEKGFLGTDEKLTISAATGGAVTQAYQALLDIPSLGDTSIYAGLRVRYEDASNLLFAGIGNGGSGTKSRYGEQRFLTLLRAGFDAGRGTHHILRIGGSAIFNNRTFDAFPDNQNGDPQLGAAYTPDSLNGFVDGVRTLELTGDLELDTRTTKNPTGTGAVVRAFGGGGSLVRRADASYAHYGIEAAYHFGLWGPGRVLVVRGAFEGVSDQNHDIPFTELPRLGGAGLLRGYKTDQFRDNDALLGTLEYHYPIHDNLSGDLFVEVGKVGDDFSDVHASGNWHLGYGGGLVAFSKSSIALRIDVAYGDGLNLYLSTDVLNAFRHREREL